MYQVESGELDSLFVALQDPEHSVWSTAWRAIIQLRDPAFVPALLSGLDIPHFRVRATIAVVLGEVGDLRALIPLINLLQHGETGLGAFENPRANAARALGQLGDSMAIEPLIAALHDPDPSTVVCSLQSLGVFKDERSVEPLLAFIHEHHDARAATILGNIGDQRAVDPLMEELARMRNESMGQDTSPSGLVQGGAFTYYVIRALGKLGDPTAIPLLEWIRDNEHEPVLKGRSLGRVAELALQHIQNRESLKA